MRAEVLGAVLLSFTTANAAGQSSPGDSLQYPPRGHYQHSAVIIAPYDPSQDRTVLQVEPCLIDSALRLSALAALIGRRPTGRLDGGVILTLWSTRPALFKSPPVRIELADSTVLDLGKAWSSPKHSPDYTEVMLAALSVSDFLRLVRSPTATLYIDGSSFPMSERHMNALRDFASRMAPLPPQ